MNRIDTITKKLTAAFQPTALDVIDESHKHIGHPGAASGAGHFAISIASEKLNHLSRVESHRMIYEVLSDLFPDEIHALRISILSSD